MPFPVDPVEANADPLTPVLGDPLLIRPEDPAATDASANAELVVFGSSEYAHAVLGGVWGQPPPLDLEAEADLHELAC